MLLLPCLACEERAAKGREDDISSGQALHPCRVVVELLLPQSQSATPYRTVTSYLHILVKGMLDER